MNATTPRGSLPAATPVLIVGAGPIGLAMAGDLGWRGIDCLLVEQGDGTIGHPRANIVNARTMEFCRRWGVADRVRAASLPPDFPLTVLHVTSLTGWELSRLDSRTHGDDAPLPFSPEKQQQCNQIYFDPEMLRLAESSANVTLRFGMRLTDFAQDESGVTATIEDTHDGTSRTVRADYMIDCSGGTSAIRDRLGIGLEGTPVLGRSVNIFFRSAELRQVHDKGEAVMFMITGPQGVWANIVALDTTDFWRLTVQGVGPEVELTPEQVETWLFETVGASFACEVKTVVRWTRRTVVAERFRDGRIFLAGDSAHQLSPSGGFGMNTGMGDVDNLGWKLEATINGWGGPGLLDSYDVERRPIATRNVTEAQGAFRARGFKTSPVLLEESPEGAALRREIGKQIDEETALSFRADGIVFGYTYAPSPIVVPDGTPAPPSSMTEYVPSTWPGARAPHVPLPDGRSTLDLFGRGFVLLCLGADAGDTAPLEKAAADKGVPLAVEHIDDETASRLYQCSFVLVRPDGHVAWRGNSLPGDPASLMDAVRGAP